MQLTPDFLKVYSLFLAINLIFIVLVLRAVYFLIQRTDPIKAVKIVLPKGLQKIFDHKRKQEIQAMREVLS